MKTAKLVVLGLMISSCDSAKEPPSRNVASGVEGATSQEVSSTEEIAFTVNVDSQVDELGLQAIEPLIDFSLKIKCVFGAARTPVERTYTKAQIVNRSATLPRKAQDCDGYLSTLDVTPKGGSKWAFLPPAAIDPIKPMSYVALNAAALVTKKTKFPSPLLDDASKNQMSFEFKVDAQQTETASTDLNVNALQVGSGAVVTGSTPPLFTIINGGSVRISGTSCLVDAVARCNTGPVVSGANIVSCSGVDFTAMKVFVGSTAVTASRGVSGLPATDIRFPIEVKNCDPGTTGVFTQSHTVKFVNDPGASSLSVPVKITIRFNPNP